MWLVWSLAACAPRGGAGTSSEPREWDGDFIVEDVVIDCDGTWAWTYDITTSGWGQLVTVDVVARDPFVGVWQEHHEVPEVDYGEGWAHHLLEVDQATDPAEQADSRSTLIACDAKTLVTWAFRAVRYDGGIQECIAWGIDPAGEFPDCVSWGTASH